MCGISGIFNYNKLPIKKEELIEFNKKQIHRGPDGEEIWMENYIGFGHTRLSIRELGNKGKQPMFDRSGRYVVTYNGEIYNTNELKNKIKNKISNLSNSDTELLINYLSIEGINCLENINGMFALAIWDKKEKLLYLVRDRSGIKPIYYFDTGKSFYFSSEIYPLLSNQNCSLELSTKNIKKYFTLGYVSNNESTFKNIFQVKPGELIKINLKGEKTYRSIFKEQIRRPIYKNLTNSSNIFQNIFSEVMSDQIQSDVPIGIFQSGGIDSNIITKFKNSDNFTIFNAVFDNQNFSEEFLSDQVKVKNRIKVKIENSIDIETFKKINFATGGQLIDPSCIPLYKLCEEAKRHNIKVILSGDGADELFAGYDTYRASIIGKYINSLIPKKISKALYNFFYSMDKGEEKISFYEILYRFFYSVIHKNMHAYWRFIMPDNIQSKLFNFQNEITEEEIVSDYSNFFNSSIKNNLSGYLDADYKYYLSSSLLKKTDTMSMANGVEIRVPFLDNRIVDFAYKCSTDVFLRIFSKNKKLLREYCKTVGIPRAIYKSKKKGFNLPISNLLRKNLKDLCDYHFLENKNLNFLVNKSYAKQIWLDHKNKKINHSYTLWSLLNFYTYYENIIN